MMRRTRLNLGATLIDVIIASFILGLLTTLLFMLLRAGLVSLKKVDNQSSLLRELQLLSLKLSREVRESNFRSLSVSADSRTTSFLSAENSEGQFQIDTAEGRPQWQKFVLYYYDEPESVIKRTEVPYAAPLPTVEQTIEDFSAATLESFIGFGTPQPVADGISFCRWEAISPGQLEFEIETQRERYQVEGIEKKRLKGRLYFRN